jgi:hypothetical protein
MGNRHPDEMPDDRERETMAIIMDTLLSVGASWPMIRHELVRLSMMENPPFISVPSQKTLERIIMEYFECQTMTEYREKRKDAVSVALKSKAVNMALMGNVPMLIFALKNVAGWSDNIKVTDPDAGKKRVITLNYSDADLDDEDKGA